jgi:hypothetical protein
MARQEQSTAHYRCLDRADAQSLDADFRKVSISTAVPYRHGALQTRDTMTGYGVLSVNDVGAQDLTTRNANHINSHFREYEGQLTSYAQIHELEAAALRSGSAT